MSTIPQPASVGTQAKAPMAALIGLILAVSMTTIDQTIVALSAPTIKDNLGLTHDGMQWAVNVYLLATAAVFLLGGRLADVLGHKKMVMIGIAAFGATSLLCGLTPTGSGAEMWLVTARALQGASAALMFPAAIGIVVGSFPRARRGKAMAAFFAVTGAMTAVGPIAGGYLTQWTWRAIFWVNVPIAIAALVIVALSATRSAARAERIDWIGAIPMAAGMALIVFGLQQAAPWGWASPAVCGSLVVGAALLVGFALLQRRTTEPLVKLQAFRDRAFTISTLATFFASFAFISVFFFLSVYGQASLQLSVADTGLLFLKLFIGFVIASRIGSSMFDKHGARPVIAIGGAIGAFGFAWLASIAANLDFDSSQFFNDQTWPIAIAGAGIGFMISAVSTDAVNRSIGSSYGEVTAISQTMKNFGGALGLAVLTSLVTTHLTDKLISSFHELGASTADAQAAVNAITGADDSASGLGAAPAALKEQIMNAVQADYASAAGWAFTGMAVAMGALIVLAAFYPKAQRTAGATDSSHESNRMVDAS